MEPIEFALVAIAIPFLSKYVEKPGERLGEHTTKQLAKLWRSIKACLLYTSPSPRDRG